MDLSWQQTCKACGGFEQFFCKPDTVKKVQDQLESWLRKQKWRQLDANHWLCPACVDKVARSIALDGGKHASRIPLK